MISLLLATTRATFILESDVVVYDVYIQKDEPIRLVD